MPQPDSDDGRSQMQSGPPPTPTQRDEPRAQSVRTVTASELLGDGGLVRIDLEGELYTLRLTRNRRLILTK